MKLYLMFIAVFLLLSSFHSYEAKGIRLGRVLFALSASSNQEIIKISSMEGSNQDHQEMLTKTDVLIPTGINRKLCMTKTTSPSTTTTISKNDMKDENKNNPKPEIKSVDGPVSYKDNLLSDDEPLYPNNIDVAEMDYTPARKKSPIHN